MNLWKNLKIAVAAVAILWIVYLLDLTLAYDLRLLGLRPRNLNGLMGILTAPFLHLDIRHLIANSGAFFFLMAISMSYSRVLTLKAILIILLFSGGLVWLFGSSDSIHIGASGIIIYYFGFTNPSPLRPQSNCQFIGWFPPNIIVILIKDFDLSCR